MKWFWVGLAIATSIYVTLSLLLYTRQARLIFFPSPTLESTPATVGLDYEDVWIEVSTAQSTERLHGWWIPASEPTGALLYLHGNGSNIGSNVNHAARFQRMGLSVLLIDYRGYGISEGSFPNEAQVYADAEAAWEFLSNSLGQRPEESFIYGHSLGGAIAINLALQHPNAAGLIVQGSFTSMQDMTYRTTPFGFLPIPLLLNQRFNSISKVSQLQMPVLFVHGTADTEVPADMSKQLYAAAPEPKSLWLVPEAGHNGLGETAGPAFFQVIGKFIEQATHKLQQKPSS